MDGSVKRTKMLQERSAGKWPQWVMSAGAVRRRRTVPVCICPDSRHSPAHAAKSAERKKSITRKVSHAQRGRPRRLIWIKTTAVLEGIDCPDMVARL